MFRYFLTLSILLILLISACDKDSTGPEEIVEWDYSYTGDINLNGIAYEIADAIVFIDYFVFGRDSFTVNVDSQRIASEINHNGKPLEISDFVYMCRIIVGDALPRERIPDSYSMNAFYDGHTVFVDGLCNAVAMTFKGNANVQICESNSTMQMRSNFDGVNTSVFVYTFDQVSYYNDLVYSDAELISIKAAGYDGENIYCKILTSPDIEIYFGQKQIYPNIKIEMYFRKTAKWELTCFEAYRNPKDNVAYFSGINSAGFYTINWDATGLREGDYRIVLKSDDVEMIEGIFRLSWDNEYWYFYDLHYFQ
ncbi:MAG: hypothetical protein ABIJ45_07815 [Candidatus Zixiibacteriota bacterium]